jgi:hypothetical protein
MPPGVFCARVEIGPVLVGSVALVHGILRCRSPTTSSSSRKGERTMWRWKAPPIRVATVIVFTRAATVVLLVGLLAGSPARAQSPLGDPMTIGVELVVGAGLTAPVTLASPPDGSGRLFVVDQVGLIRVLRPDRILQKEPFLDLRDRLVALRVTFDERGLLGLAFHPQYATSGRFFVY